MEQPLLRADARANRARLIEVAHEVFRERGLDAEMKEIAERAGLGIATLYRNFATREDLVDAMVAEVLQRMQTIIVDALAEPDAIGGLRLLLRSACEMLEQYGYLMSVFHENDRLPRAHEHEEQHLEKERQIVEPLMALVEKGVEAGIFRAGLDIELVAYRIFTSLLPPLYAHLRRTRSVDEIVDRNVNLLLYGMVRPP